MRTSEYKSTNPIKKLHPGEPWFFLRAQDKLSVEAVKHYALLLQEVAERVSRDTNLSEADAVSLALSLSDQATEVAEYAMEFNEWQKKNPDKVKYPD